MKKYFVKLTSRLLHSTIHHVMWYFWVFIVNPFSLLCSIFFLKKVVFPFVSLSLAYRWVSQARYFWQSYRGVFVENPFFLLSNIVNLDKLNSIDWLLISVWLIFLKWFLFYCWKIILIWQKILEAFWRIYLNIIFSI